MPPEENLLSFRRVVLAHYRQHGRDLPWRHTRDPYRILVSEIMLQQTQVSRVLPKYDDFLARFPDVCVTGRQPHRGGPRRLAGPGIQPQRPGPAAGSAQVVVSDYGGSLPRSQERLRALPGIGPATAGAIAAFAYGLPVPFIETNIRAAILHHFFPGRLEVPDREVLPLVEATLDREDPRTWYYALMDYGSWLKTDRSRTPLVAADITSSSRRSSAHGASCAPRSCASFCRQDAGETASTPPPCCP